MKEKSIENIVNLGGDVLRNVAVFLLIESEGAVKYDDLRINLRLTSDELDESIALLMKTETIGMVGDMLCVKWQQDMRRYGLRPFDSRIDQPGTYVEEMLATIMGGEVTSYREKGHDIVLKNGIKIEVKMSRLCNSSGGGRVKQFGYGNLIKDLISQYYIFTGFDEGGEMVYDITNADIYLVPTQVVNTRVESSGSLRINLTGKGRDYDWNCYRVTLDDLKQFGEYNTNKCLH